MWDDFALELINASGEDDIKRRDLYDGAPLLATFDPQRLWSPWAKGPVALCGDAAHPMMPNLGQGGCQASRARTPPTPHIRPHSSHSHPVSSGATLRRSRTRTS